VKRKISNPLTLKIKYTCADSDVSTIAMIIEAYNPVIRFTYNRVEEKSNINTKELSELQSKLNNINPIIGSHLFNSAQYQAKAMYKSRKATGTNKPLIFGGRKNFVRLCQHKITKEEWLEKRLLPLHSVGEANQKGNRLFRILDTHTVLFKPNKDIHINLDLQSVGKNNTRKLKRLIELQNQKAISLTYQLDKEYVYITYDNSIFEQYNYALKSNRVMAIDLNPNYIGWSVMDWQDNYNYTLVDSGMFSLKLLNDYRDSLHIKSSDKLSIYVTNKRNHEIIDIAKQLFNLCQHYHCETFAIEDLSINSVTKETFEDRNRRKLINNHWNRNLLIQQITKHIKSSPTSLVEVKPEYSSIIGNLVNRRLGLPDPVLASIEIGRRGFEYSTQYIFKRRPVQKTVIFPLLEAVIQAISLSLEELGINVPEQNKWEDVFKLVKNPEVKYRVPLSKSQLDSPCSKIYKQKYLTVYNF